MAITIKIINMRKIRRFSVNENVSVLSAEEMRRISGGQNPCNPDGCVAMIEYVGGGVFTYDGECALRPYEGYFVCACVTSAGDFYADGECD